jgi:hypothetical protein
MIKKWYMIINWPNKLMLYKKRSNHFEYWHSKNCPQTSVRAWTINSRSTWTSTWMWTLELCIRWSLICVQTHMNFQIIFRLIWGIWVPASPQNMHIMFFWNYWLKALGIVYTTTQIKVHESNNTKKNVSLNHETELGLLENK